jgi:hypothetical protein
MDNVDMDNLSTDMRLGGKLALPLGSSEFTVKDLLERYKPDSLIKVDVNDEGVVMLYAENFVDYKTPDLSQQFGELVSDMTSFSVETQPLNLKNVGFDAMTPRPGFTIQHEATVPFDFNSLNQNNTVQEITRILFQETSIKVSVNTYGKNYPKGFLVMTMQIPGTTDSIVIDPFYASIDHRKTNLMIYVNKAQTTDYKIKFKITGDGITPIALDDMINISISFDEDSKYVVYGYFYYNDGNPQMQPYHVNLFSYLPEGTDLRLYAPSIKFNVTSNIGIPFIFDLGSITSYLHGEQQPRVVATHLVKDSVIHRARDLVVAANSTITIDTSTFPNNNASDIFNTKLDSISTAYTFRAPMRGSSLIDTVEQFIASDSWMKLTASIQMPFWLDAGSVFTYADTILKEDFDNEYITSASLIFDYTSNLPVSFALTITLLDENKEQIQVSPSSSEKYSYNIEAASVDGRGVVTIPSDGQFIIDYSGSMIDELKKAKHVVINLKATGATPGSKIKIMDTNSLKIRAELRTEGGLTVENGKLRIAN